MTESVFSRLLRAIPTPEGWREKLGLAPADLLAQIKTVDGTGSGLDADTVDGAHYETGTFTPTITASSGTFTTVSATGSYVKIGRLVAFNILVSVTTPGTAAGQMRFTLPYAAADSWVVSGLNASTGADLRGAVNSPSSTSGFVIEAGGAFAANFYRMGGVYEATS